MIQWIIEEENIVSGEKRRLEFNDYNDALDMFESLRGNDQFHVTLQKNQKRLLTENL